MAQFGTYYLDTDDFLTATSVWLDSDLSQLAPDGWYKFNDKVRRQVNGVLTDPDDCPQCIVQCNNLISVNALNAGVYSTRVNLGTGTNAEVIRFTTDKPIGIDVIYNGNSYTEVVSENFGLLTGGYYGDSSLDDCSGGLISASPHNLTVYEYSGGVFVDTGVIEVVDVAGTPGLTASDPGTMLLVFPKQSPVPYDMEIRITVFCPNTNFTVDAKCPTPLTRMESSVKNNNHPQACADTIDQVYRYVPVVVSFSPPDVGDVVYEDQVGVNKLADTQGVGYYRITDYTIEIDANSIIVGRQPCTDE